MITLSIILTNTSCKHERYKIPDHSDEYSFEVNVGIRTHVIDILVKQYEARHKKIFEKYPLARTAIIIPSKSNGWEIDLED